MEYMQQKFSRARAGPRDPNDLTHDVAHGGIATISQPAR